MSFSTRHNLRRTPPPRNKYEQAPDDLRLVLRDALIEDRGWLGAYRVLCDARHQLPSSGIWGHDFAREPALEMLEDLKWFEVFDLLEEYGDPEAVVPEPRSLVHPRIERPPHPQLADPQPGSRSRWR